MSPVSIAPVLSVALTLLAAPAFAQKPEPVVHPFCVRPLAQIVNSRFQTPNAAPIQLVECNRHYQRAAVDYGNGAFSAKIPITTAGRTPFYKYRIVGNHRDVTILDVSEGAGGPAVFSAIVLVAGWPKAAVRAKIEPDAEIRLAGLFERGDRCNGGIAEASLTSPSTLRIAENLTPYDLFILRPTRALRRAKAGVLYEAVQNPTIEPVSARLLELEPYRDLDAAPTSCIGTATTDFDLEKGTSRLVSITLTGLINKDPKWVARHKHQACFNKVVAAAVPTFPKTLDSKQVLTMSEAFELECLDAPAP